MSEKSRFVIAGDEVQQMLASARVRLVDGSWYLPAQNRDAKAEFMAARIPGAVRFDIDEISDRSSALPHMLPTPENFGAAMGALGISEDDDIIVYDGPGMFSAARVWWNLRVMGAKSVRILEGGFDRWQMDGRPVETGAPKSPEPALFKAVLDADRVRGIADMRANLKSGNAQVLDARPFARFCGTAPEPRPGLRSGHIPGSQPVPATELFSDGKLKPLDELREVFNGVALAMDRPAITTCGSGVTAAVISLALESIGHTDHSLYDGSWAEWGQAEDAPVAQWLDGEVSGKTTVRE
ncbi:MAG: 3-mercaptopyruvate sulfurtransferase [Nitratireductor sp.]|nr:3-mercaptopyruvate sulfurtransferase [Nitratireductor sp.]MCB1459780.1 3-mercaptopyruvate sulfurtransferase [Nitratireductor sp.]